MKRIATAAVAATLSMSALSAPAFAADADTAPAKENQGSSAQAEGGQAGEKVGSSEVYKQCKEGKKAEAEKGKEATAGKDGDKAEPGKEKGSNNATGECIQQLIDNPDTKPGILGLLIGVPLALVALLGAAAAFSGAIPGVQLPALPGLPM
ncbi:opacity protein-like surface antigen [Corynebacterium afermentans]